MTAVKRDSVGSGNKSILQIKVTTGGNDAGGAVAPSSLLLCRRRSVVVLAPSSLRPHRFLKLNFVSHCDDEGFPFLCIDELFMFRYNSAPTWCFLLTINTQPCFKAACSIYQMSLS